MPQHFQPQNMAGCIAVLKFDRFELSFKNQMHSMPHFKSIILVHYQ